MTLLLFAEEGPTAHTGATSSKPPRGGKKGKKSQNKHYAQFKQLPTDLSQINDLDDGGESQAQVAQRVLRRASDVVEERTSSTACGGSTSTVAPKNDQTNPLDLHVSRLRGVTKRECREGKRVP